MGGFFLLTLQKQDIYRHEFVSFHLVFLYVKIKGITVKENSPCVLMIRSQTVACRKVISISKVLKMFVQYCDR